jgi:hypothetical protein
MKRITLFLLAVLVTVSSSHAVLPPSASFLSRPTIIPIEVVRSGHIAVRAMINGSGPYRFIFDTGAPSLLISEQVARDARIIPRSFTRPFFAPLGNLGEMNVKSVTLGRSAQANLSADIWNHPTVELLGRMFGRFEGLIGFPFFAHYQVTIDYKSRTMTLVPSPFEPEDTREKMTRRMTDSSPAKVFAPAETLGIQISKAAKDETAGVDITTVMPLGPAADAGLKPGDRLLTLDGRWTDSVEDCYRALDAVDSPRAVPVTVLRNGTQLSLTLTVQPGI